MEINGVGSKLIADKDANIEKVQVKAEKVTIEGKGKVVEVEVKKEGSNASITTPNTEIKVDKEAKDIKGTGNVAIKTDETYVNGKTDKENAKPLKKPNTGGSSSGGSSGGSSDDTGGDTETPAEKYKVTYSVKDGNGTLTSSTISDSSVGEGTKVVFTASPSIGYEVKEWKVDEIVVSTSGNSLERIITANTTVTVEFKKTEIVPVPDKPTITYSVIGENGTLTSEIASGSKVETGTSVTLNARPDTTYEVKEWKVNGEVMYEEVEGDYGPVTFWRYELENITEDTVVTVEFKRAPKQMLKYSVKGIGGTVTADYDNNSEIYYGTKVTFTAHPEDGYKVHKWKVDNYTRQNGGNELVTSYNNDNFDVRVEFVKIAPVQKYKVTYEVIGGNGTLTGNVASGLSVNEGTDVTFTATPNAGYRVIEWNVNDEVVAVGDEDSGYVVRDLEYTLTGIRENTTVTVRFEQIPPQYSLTYSVSGGVGGTIEALTARDELIESGTSVDEHLYIVIKATPRNGYRVKEWNYNGEIFGSQDNLIKVVYEDTVITVEFEKIKHNVSFWIGGNPVHSELVSHGDKVIKMPNAPTQGGKIFLGWFDYTPEGVTTEITAETIVTKDIIASADWENVPNPMVTFDTVGGNDIDPIEVVWGELLTPPENPIRGYDEFHHWTIGGTNEPFDLEANPITEDITLYAKYTNYYKIKFDVTPSNAVVTFDGETNGNNEFIKTAYKYAYTVELDGYVSRQRNEYWVYGDDTITVNLKKISHDIVFKVDGETYISVSIEHGEKLELPDEPTKQGKRFVGWFIEEGVTEVTEDTIVTERLTALAKWEDIPNTPPLAVDDTATAKSHSLSGVLIDVLENDTDEDNDTLTVASHTQGTNGTVTLIDNKLKYLPNPDFLGTDTFTYTISDERGGSDTATVTVTVLPKYTVTYSVVGFDYGTMQGNIASGSEVVEGGEVIFTAFPNDGYRVAGWQVDGSYQDEESNTFTLSPVTKDTVVALMFEKIPERYTLTFEVDGENGTINDTILSGSEFDAGEILTIKTSPADGYRVAKWNINGVEKPDDHYYSHTFTLEEDTHIIVSFELEPVKNTYSVTIGVEGDNPGNCTVVTNLSEDKLSAIEEGKLVIFSGSNYYPTYRIKAWRVNGVVNGSTDSNLLIKITADTHVTAEFELAQ